MNRPRPFRHALLALAACGAISGGVLFANHVTSGDGPGFPGDGLLEPSAAYCLASASGVELA